MVARQRLLAEVICHERLEDHLAPAQRPQDVQGTHHVGQVVEDAQAKNEIEWR